MSGQRKLCRMVDEALAKRGLTVVSRGRALRGHMQMIVRNASGHTVKVPMACTPKDPVACANMVAQHAVRAFKEETWHRRSPFRTT